MTKKVAYNKILTGIVAASILSGGIASSTITTAYAVDSPAPSEASASTTTPDSDKYEVTWAQASVMEGGSAKLSRPAINWQSNYKDGVGYTNIQNQTYSIDTSSLPNYIDMTIAEDGSVEITSQKVTLPNEDPVLYRVPVTITFEDGSQDNTFIDFIFYPITGNETLPTEGEITPAPAPEPATPDTTTPENERYVVEYADGTVTAGGTASYSEPAINWEPTYKQASGFASPENVKFALADSFKGIEGVTVNVDSQTGAIKLETLSTVTAGDYTIDVLTTYSDGTTDVTPVKLTIKSATPIISQPNPPEETDPTQPVDTPVIPSNPITPPTTDEETPVTTVDDATKYVPEYATVEVEAGGSASLSAPAINWSPDYKEASGVPNAEVSEFTIDSSYTAPEGVVATIDSKTGAVSLVIDSKATPGDYTIPVVVKYADGSSDKVDVTYKIKESSVPVDNTPTEPEPTTPEPTEPEPTTPEPTTPEPEPTTPEPSVPEPTTPEPTTPVETDDSGTVTTPDTTEPIKDAPIADNVSNTDTPKVNGEKVVVQDDGRVVTESGQETGLKVEEDGTVTLNGEEAVIDQEGRVLVNGQDTGIKVAGNLKLNRNTGTTQKGTTKTVTQATANTGGDIDAGNTALGGALLASAFAGLGAFIAGRRKK